MSAFRIARRCSVMSTDLVDLRAGAVVAVLPGERIG
jgi:hypothetical protein